MILPWFLHGCTSQSSRQPHGAWWWWYIHSLEFFRIPYHYRFSMGHLKNGPYANTVREGNGRVFKNLAHSPTRMGNLRINHIIIIPTYWLCDAVHWKGAIETASLRWWCHVKACESTPVLPRKLICGNFGSVCLKIGSKEFEKLGQKVHLLFIQPFL